MSLVTQISGSGPDELWKVAAIPVALAVDLALGDVPGRTYPITWLRWLIATIEGGIRRAVSHLGGGRGGELFCGASLGVLAVGTVAGSVWMAVDAADAVGGAATLVVRAAFIAAGLIIRATGDPILNAVEAADRPTAAAWFRRAGGSRPPWLERLGAVPVGVAAVGELLSSRIVAPLFWLAVGGPAGLWGFVAARSLRETMLVRDERSDLAGQILVRLADVAEAIPATITAGLIVLSAAVTRADAAHSARSAWRQARTRPRLPGMLPGAALAGALDVRLPGGRVFAARPNDLEHWFNPSASAPSAVSVIRAIRIMQVAAIMAASLVALLSLPL